jgi:multidrug transporter EmrE-like cation transporter
MIYLALSVLCSVLIANFLMLVGRKGALSMLPIFLGNYFVASLSGAFSMRTAPVVASGFDLGIGLLTGAFFLLNFWVYQKCIVANGLSLSVGAMRIAMILPIVISLLFFEEQLSTYNLLGIILGIAAFSLRADPRALRNFLWIIALFAISGLSDASMKIFKELGSGNEAFFVYLIFSSAFVYTLIAILVSRLRFEPRYIFYGFALGIPNRYSTVFFLNALDSIPAAIAYPLLAVSIVIMSIISDILFWKKRPGTKDYILWLLLILSLILLNS